MPAALSTGLAAAAVALASAFATGPASAADADRLLSPVPLAAPTQPATPWEGAIGLLMAHRPAFSGSDGAVTKLTPGFFLRYGRFTVTNASGFVTRRADDVQRGVGVELVESSRVRVRLGLRWDNGRRESSSDGLRGLGDIPRTVRARMALNWTTQSPWSLGLSVSSDIFGRGGGYIADATLGWSHAWSPVTQLSANFGLSYAGDRYLQTWYGVTPAQSLSSGLPAFQAHTGWRDVSAGFGFRHDLSRDWLLIGGVGVSRLLGDAARSPLTTQRLGWGVNAGLAWRF